MEQKFSNDINNFDYRISFVRVLAMISIIIGHWCSFAGIYTYQLGSIGVQIFIFLSGYIYGKKNISNILTWGGRRLKRLMPPLWCTLSIVLVIHSFLGDPFKTSQVLLHTFNIQGLDHFFTKFSISKIPGMAHTWFVTVIAICYACTALLKHFKEIELYIRKHIKQTFITAVILQICLSYCGIQISLIIEFFIGYFLAGKNWLTKKIFIIVTAGSVIFGFIRIILRNIIDGSVFYDDIIAEISFDFLAIWIVMILFFLCNMNKNAFLKLTNTRCWKFLDLASYPLYLVHYMFLVGEISVSNWVGGSIITQTIVFVVLTLISATVVTFLTNISYEKRN